MLKKATSLDNFYHSFDLLLQLLARAIPIAPAPATSTASLGIKCSSTLTATAALTALSVVDAS